MMNLYLVERPENNSADYEEDIAFVCIAESVEIARLIHPNFYKWDESKWTQHFENPNYTYSNIDTTWPNPNTLRVTYLGASYEIESRIVLVSNGGA